MNDSIEIKIQLDGELDGINKILITARNYRQILEDTKSSDASRAETIAHITHCIDHLQFVLDNINSRTIITPILWESDKEMFRTTSENLLRAITHHYTQHH